MRWNTITKIFLILIMTISSFSISMHAQDSFYIADVLNEKYVKGGNLTIVDLEGESLKSKNLTKYKSVSIEGNEAYADKISSAVLKDGKNAVSKEISLRDGKLYFGFYYMGELNRKRRYILFLDRRAVGRTKTTLIYLEGALGSEEVKKLIKK